MSEKDKTLPKYYVSNTVKMFCNVILEVVFLLYLSTNAEKEKMPVHRKLLQQSFICLIINKSAFGKSLNSYMFLLNPL